MTSGALKPYKGTQTKKVSANQMQYKKNDTEDGKCKLESEREQKSKRKNMSATEHRHVRTQTCESVYVGKSEEEEDRRDIVSPLSFSGT